MNNKRTKIIVSVVLIVAVAVSAVFIFAEEKLFYPIKYRDIVAKYSAVYGVEEELILAVINTESRFNPDAVSEVGAIGLMQITPETFAWLQTKDDTEDTLADVQLYDPEINIKYGTLLLSLNIAEYGNRETAIASYNAGRGKVSAWLSDKKYSSDSRTLTLIPYEETRRYVEKVNRSYKIYKEKLNNN